MSEAGRDAPREIAGRYEILERLGAGAFGTVYKARDRVLGRMVAIKTIRLEGLAATGVGVSELVERFEREARISAQLRHPHIVTIYDVGESGGLSYLAMEFLDGLGLDQLVLAERRLDAVRAAGIGAQVADALDYAHAHDVVHRDVKPANIMVEAGDRVKVTDFGIARVTTASDRLTASGSLLGTPSYMSPEQARGRDLDGRSDLFSLGCVLYEMVAGVKAFEGDSITGLIFKIITEPPPPLAARVPGLSRELIRVIERALEKDPARRYPTGAALATDLRAVAGLAAPAAPAPDVTEAPTVALAATEPALGAPRPAPGPAVPAAPDTVLSAPAGGQPAGTVATSATAPRRSQAPAVAAALALIAAGALLGVWMARRAFRHAVAPPAETSAAVAVRSPPPADSPTPEASAPADGSGSAPGAAPPAQPTTPVAEPGQPPAPGLDEAGVSEAQRELFAQASPGERPVLVALHVVARAEQAFRLEQGRYAGLPELIRAQRLTPAELIKLNLLRRSYAFDLHTGADGFRLTASPIRPGLRGFVVDESGQVRPAGPARTRRPGPG